MISSMPDSFFPYENIRDSQKQLIEDITSAIKERKHIIAHAPTGLGKTVASLAPAIALAEKQNLTIMFLTSRHTQHKIALDTTRAIKEKFKLKTGATSILGKRWMCAQPGIDAMGSSEFSDYCRMLRSEDLCEFYIRARPKDTSLSHEGKLLADELTLRSPVNAEEFISGCKEKLLCPYEIGLAVAAKNRVVVTDYFYIFNPSIADGFLAKIGKNPEDLILVIDEGHNLPNRMREMMSSGLTTHVLASAKKEADKLHHDEVLGYLSEIEDAVIKLTPPDKEERPVTKEEFLASIEAIAPIKELIEELRVAADDALVEQIKSAIASVAEFLESWQGPNDGYARFFRKTTSRRGQEWIGLYNNCLDPSLASAEVIKRSHSTILMSGTLTPTSMYRDLLGFEAARTVEKEYPSPFDEKNRLTLVVPKTTTKFAKRSETQFLSIAQECASASDAIPGNVACFFPSYFIRDAVYAHFSTLARKTVFLEDPGMTKTDRDELLERFKSYKKNGAVLMAVAAGSFGEGVDLPGDLLNGVIVVGLPLSKPDLETDALIKYYDQKFGKGWDYGYVLPAMTKTLQNAGRCIRTENDRGAIMFLDERFAWPQYLKSFPTTWNIKITTQFMPEIEGFFGKMPSGSLLDY